MSGDDTRIVTLMGSGELAPTMVRVHRAVLEELGGRPVPAVFLGTPFGFQENAEELSQRAVTYFDESLQTPLRVAAAGGERLDDARLAAEIGAARYVFSGPGSPTYALRQWNGSVLPQLLREKLRFGGAVTFASAAALTLGAFTVPVYEIYKVGEAPHWLEGLDVLAAADLRVAVVPHYNNAEGGTHDTRFCYLGERRLALMEELLPDDAFVLGVDEHSALIIDLVSRRARVDGIGVVTVRYRGHSVVFESGSVLSIDQLIAAAFDVSTRHGDSIAPSSGPAVPDAQAPSASPLLDIIRAREDAFDQALATRDAPAIAANVLGLESDLHEWATDIPGQDELARARASLRAMIGRLGELANSGLRSPREIVGNFVDLLVEQRTKARAERRFNDADDLRSRLEDLGVELRDTPGSTEWLLEGESGGITTPE
jgi:hypothetical protein